MFPYKKAIVTGGAGFIGSHICEELLGLGVEVTSIDDYSAGKEENLREFAANPRFRAVKCDVTDYNELKKYFDGVDVVFHEAASKKNICLIDPRRDLEVNGKGTFNILELCRDSKVKKLVHASTGSVYGEAVKFPQDENHPLNPVSYYGVSKLAGERYAMVFRKLDGLDVTVLRYFHVYGPRQDAGKFGGVVSIFGRRILEGLPPVIFGDGTQQRSFTYVKDVAAANIFAAADPRTSGQCYNCASGIKVSVRDLADNLLRIAGRPELKIEYGDWTPGDIKIFDIDNSKIKELGFEFKAEFLNGLETTYKWLAIRKQYV